MFVAHNARFDYGFLKNEFRRTGQRHTNRFCLVCARISDCFGKPAFDPFTLTVNGLDVAANDFFLEDGVWNADARFARKKQSHEEEVGDEDYQTSSERFLSQPTVNIQGLVGGYTGPGGKTILPYRAAAKIEPT